MSFSRIPNPGQIKECERGCGAMTVLAELGDGRTARLHCGTFLPRCTTSTSSKKRASVTR